MVSALFFGARPHCMAIFYSNLPITFQLNWSFLRIALAQKAQGSDNEPCRPECALEASRFETTPPHVFITLLLRISILSIIDIIFHHSHYHYD